MRPQGIAHAAASLAAPWWRELGGQVEGGMSWLVGFWMAGVLILSVRQVGGWVVVQRLKRKGVQPAAAGWQERLSVLGRRLDLSRPVQLLVSVRVEAPVVIGWLRPVILMPVGMLTGLSVSQVEAILLHELAHVRRCDYLVNLLQAAVETLLFYHPAVWWVSRRIREERECCCDDLAVEACGKVLGYARALVALEDWREGGLRLQLAAGGGSMLGRVQRLVERSRAPAGAGRVPCRQRLEAGFADRRKDCVLYVLANR